MFYKVRDPICAVSNVDDYSASARLLAATTLRNVLGTKSLKEILSDRENIARDMQACGVINILHFIYLSHPKSMYWDLGLFGLGLDNSLL